jgi:hypothetical protein
MIIRLHPGSFIHIVLVKAAIYVDMKTGPNE